MSCHAGSIGRGVANGPDLLRALFAYVDGVIGDEPVLTVDPAVAIRADRDERDARDARRAEGVTEGVGW
ncbi:hypothetical protein [Frankia sp. Cas3]|uniref:hypothetical protein n=1 Tax=Frankia sp. Cas3 TaxID=3073926 RepID=UPI002AD36BAE|nr:hypothetical protein [Frankia sp. Cas3]